MFTRFFLVFLLFSSLSIFSALREREEYQPWYSGPIIANSAENVSPNVYFINPYVYITNTYAVTDSSWKRHSIPNKHTIQGLLDSETGITKWLSVKLSLAYTYNERQGKKAQELNDPALKFGIQLLRQKEFTAIPSIRLKVEESFPTAKYKNLNPDKKKVDAIGTGTYQTNLGINLSKIVYWIQEHPMNFTFNFLYSILSDVKVSGFHAYGGGYGTKGTVKPGNQLALDLAVEYSFNQKWAIGSDIYYVHSNSNHFSGTLGVKADGSPAINALPSSEQFSLAPVLEYTYSQHIGFYIGSWFTFASRNSASFVLGTASVAFLF